MDLRIKSATAIKLGYDGRTVLNRERTLCIVQCIHPQSKKRKDLTPNNIELLEHHTVCSRILLSYSFKCLQEDFVVLRSFIGKKSVNIRVVIKAMIREFGEVIHETIWSVEADTTSLNTLDRFGINITLQNYFRPSLV